MLSYAMPVFGGVLIGLAAVLLLLFLGRIAGISGIFWQALTAVFSPLASARSQQDSQQRSQPSSLLANVSQYLWCWLFLIGLPVGVWLFHSFTHQPIPEASPLTGFDALIAGLLVGIGTRLGGGCTSGHGVCGIGRLSIRSIVATCVFMLTAMVTVFIIRHGV